MVDARAVSANAKNAIPPGDGAKENISSSPQPLSTCISHFLYACTTRMHLLWAMGSNTPAAHIPSKHGSLSTNCIVLYQRGYCGCKLHNSTASNQPYTLPINWRVKMAGYSEVMIDDPAIGVSKPMMVQVELKSWSSLVLPPYISNFRCKGRSQLRTASIK